jgi:hypothetical protein
MSPAGRAKSEQKIPEVMHSPGEKTHSILRKILVGLEAKICQISDDWGIEWEPCIQSIKRSIAIFFHERLNLTNFKISTVSDVDLIGTHRPDWRANDHVVIVNGY